MPLLNQEEYKEIGNIHKKMLIYFKISNQLYDYEFWTVKKYSIQIS